VFLVICLVLFISAARSFGLENVKAVIVPNAPAFETALVNSAREIHIVPSCITGY
jgi:hypothetical protein